MSQDTSPLAKVGVVVVPVADQDIALSFYIEKLGFELRADEMYGEGMRWVEVALPHAETNLALTRPISQDHPRPGGQTPITFVTDDVESARERLAARGVAVGEVQRMGGGVPPMAELTDADGNRFWLVERHD